MGAAARRKKILEPLNKLGISKISNIEEALIKQYGKERAAEITETRERLSKTDQ